VDISYGFIARDSGWGEEYLFVMLSVATTRFDQNIEWCLGFQRLLLPGDQLDKGL